MASDVYKRGSKGPEVKRIQERLRELGYFTDSPDEIFGPKTEDALKKFQRERHLQNDGIMGRQTRAVLFPRFNFTNYAKLVGSHFIGERSQTEIGWYRWKVFVDEPDEKLDEIESVEYRLHETFPHPIQIINNRRSKFALVLSGWGEFWIYITVYLKDGTESNEQYYLDLGKPWPGSEE